MEHEFFFFQGSNSSKKREFNFSCKFITLTTHDFHFCFACLKRLHNIQSNILQTEKHAKYFFFMKNGFIIWGAGPKGPDKRKALAPHIMNSFFMKTKSIHCFLSVCKKLD